MFAISIIIFLLSAGTIFISFLLRNTLDMWSSAWLVSGIILKPGESILIAFPGVDLSEARARRSSSGTGFTIMKGVRLYSGSSKSTDEMTHIDSGPFLVTDKRILFRGLKQTRAFSHKKIVSITPTWSGIMLNISGRKKAQLFTGIKGHIEYEYEGDVYRFKVTPTMFAGVISTIITQSVGS